MIVFVILLPVRILSWNARRPNNDSLPLDVVPEEFGCPDINGRCVLHDLDETLFAPVYQILRTGIAEASVASPTGRPHQMEHTVRCADDARIAHHTLIPHLRFQPHALYLLPRPSVTAIDKPQSVCSRFVE